MYGMIHMPYSCNPFQRTEITMTKKKSKQVKNTENLEQVKEDNERYAELSKDTDATVFTREDFLKALRLASAPDHPKRDRK